MAIIASEEDQQVLVRGSAEHQDYLKHAFGSIKDMVNAFETRIAIAGRALIIRLCFIARK